MPLVMTFGKAVMDKYSRLYCGNCKLIYGIGATSYLRNCTECGHPLQIKSFNPWPKVIGAVVLLCIGLMTVLFNWIPIIWIGAFLWAIGLIFNSFRQWSKIKGLDNPYKSQYDKSKYAKSEYKVNEDLKDNADYTVINCGACFHKYRVRKGQGIVVTKCPSCGRKAKIMT